MVKPKLTRRQLALRIFGVIMLVNAVLWFAFAPAPEAATPTKPVGMVELKIRGVLHSPFTHGMAVLLTGAGTTPVGPVTVLAQEGETLLLAVPEAFYRGHHTQLTTQDWIVLPFLEGMQHRATVTKGMNYEIAY